MLTHPFGKHTERCTGVDADQASPYTSFIALDGEIPGSKRRGVVLFNEFMNLSTW